MGVVQVLFAHSFANSANSAGAKQEAPSLWDSGSLLLSLHPSAEQSVTKLWIWSEIAGKHPSVAKARVDSIGLIRGFKPPSPSALSFVTACEALG